MKIRKIPDHVMNESRTSAHGTAWSDDEWYAVLDDLQSNPDRYIPVIGPELMQVRDGDRSVNLLCLLGERVADKLRLSRSELASTDIKDVVRVYLMRRRKFDLDKPYAAIEEVLAESAWLVPEPVRKLASIRHFQFFLNTTWLPFLATALKEERSFPVTEKSSLPGKPMEDFDDDDIASSICVFNLFGMAGSTSHGYTPLFSVTDCDLLEAMHRLLSSAPPRLSAHLLANNRELLVCGCSFSNWLARFFFYSLAGSPLSAGQGLRMRVVAEQISTCDDSLRAFWARMNAPVFDCASAVAFVDELHDRWHAEFGDTPDPLERSAERALVSNNPFTAGQVFVSYAREDADMARHVAERLKAAGLPVWFDLECLESGHLYRARIRANIQCCSIFLPIISGNAIRKVVENGFLFREEWLHAREQSEIRRDGMGQNDFILPVCIDPSVDLYDQRLPDFIRDRHIESLSDGIPGSWLARVNAARKAFARNKK